VDESLIDSTFQRTTSAESGTPDFHSAIRISPAAFSFMPLSAGHTAQALHCSLGASCTMIFLAFK
jgi:hypothetical protein